MALTARQLEYHRQYREKHRDEAHAAQKRWYEKSGAESRRSRLEIVRANARKYYHKVVGNQESVLQEREIARELRLALPPKCAGAKERFSAVEKVVRRKATVRRARYRHVAGIPDLLKAPSICQVCGGSYKISLDHCHVTATFRGWLCDGCNRALGNVKDDPKVLRALADYLEKHSEKE